MNLDFGYPWWITYAHLVPLAGVAAIGSAGLLFKWPKWVLLVLAALALWFVAGFLVMRFGLNAGGVPSLPTEDFLRSGAGRVLDMGAGTGRSSIMVLEARPKATLVALDLFAESFDQHFGKAGAPQDRLMANLRAAGVAERASIAAGDMRKLPFQAGEFDAIVSSYAIDHLSRDGSAQALSEAARVAKPGADFLLMVIFKDPWIKFAAGPLTLHGGTRSAEWWTGHLQEAGFEVVESGTRPATFYVLSRRR